MTDGWSSRRLDLVLPASLAREMWAHARQWDVGRGGRFEVTDDDVLVLWSGSFSARPVMRVVAIEVCWDGPHPDTATIRRLAWNPRMVGEIEPWRVLKVLAGQRWSIVFAAALGPGHRASSPGAA
jgi:hypothetical protein